MPQAITIADDSKISRKMIIRALPPDWEVEITQAENGLEALAASKAGKAEVLFLDLTMPEMDGFQVLEQLHKIDSPTMVFVISADIQAEAQQRVKELGACTFIKKPFKAEDIEQALHEYGIL